MAVVHGASNNTIGGTTAAARNVIAGNAGNGVYISGAGTTGNLVAGDYIGTNAAGATLLATAATGSSSRVARPTNTIGGTAAAGDTIAENTLAGVAVVGVSTTRITVRGNSIFANGGLGIDLEEMESRRSRQHGHFGSQQLAELSADHSVSGGTTTTVNISFVSLPKGSYTIDFYASAEPDPSGYGQGQRYLGSLSVVTDLNGQIIPPTAFSLAAATSSGEWITATATDTAGDTSEFSMRSRTPIGLFAVPTPNSVPVWITAGPDGNMWFTEAVGNKVGRISPSGAITEFPIPGEAGSPGPCRRSRWQSLGHRSLWRQDLEDEHRGHGYRVVLDPHPGELSRADRGRPRGALVL